MAGDHKCPVCNSTFTRPQHVARHMRSHTGDRPYKCTTCGDQFARSDLLSRHVNKCHAADRPPTTNSRRRGSAGQAAAASRVAAAYKQCDQCAQGGVSCDLRAPCTACTNRKLQCTYPRSAKHPRRASRSGLGDGSSSERLGFAHDPSSVYPSTSLGVPAMSAQEPIFSGGPQPNYNFPGQLFLPNAPALAHPSTDLRLPHSSRINTSSLSTLDASYPQYPTLSTTQYPSDGRRAHSSLAHSAQAPNSLDTWSLAPAPSYASNDPASALPSSISTQGLHHTSRHLNYSGDLSMLRYDSPSSSTHSMPSPQPLLDLQSSEGFNYNPYTRGHSHSDSGGTHSDFSSNSSPAIGPRGLYQEAFRAGSRPSTQPSPSPGSQSGQPNVDQQQGYHLLPQVQQHGEGGFSSSFGLLSLEEQGTLQGQLSMPFFSHGPFDDAAAGNMVPRSATYPGSTGAWPNESGNVRRGSSLGPVADGPAGANRGHTAQVSPGGTAENPGPIPDNVPAILSPDSEARQMRDFWKLWIQTPGGETPGETAPQQANGPHPGMSRTISMTKTTSLPPSRRPARSGYDEATPHASAAQLGHQPVNPAAQPRSVVNPQELRSYEAAVLSRPQPTLKLEPRTRGAFGGVCPPSTADPRLRGGALSDSGYSAHSPRALADRPIMPLPRQFAVPQSTSRPSTSSGRSDDGTSAAAAQYSSDDARPAFKRLPSQTLGPSYSKRAVTTKIGMSPAGSASGGDADVDDDRAESSDDNHGARQFRHILPASHDHATPLARIRRASVPGVRS